MDERARRLATLELRRRALVKRVRETGAAAEKQARKMLDLLRRQAEGEGEK